MGSIVRQYTTQEVGGFLKDSEGAQMPYEQGQGHAEGLHELSSAGKRRKNTTVADLRQRIVDEVKETVGAFDGCQIEAVTFLSTQTQAKMRWLTSTRVPHGTSSRR